MAAPCGAHCHHAVLRWRHQGQAGEWSEPGAIDQAMAIEGLAFGAGDRIGVAASAAPWLIDARRLVRCGHSSKARRDPLRDQLGRHARGW